MSQEDTERLIGRAYLEYSEAKKSLALHRDQLKQLGQMLKNFGEALQESGLERAHSIITRNPLELVDTAKLRQSLQDVKDTEARLEASKKALLSYGAPVE